MLKTLTATVAAAATFFCAASAATFSLDSTSGAVSVPGGYQFTADGITLTVTAGVFNNAGVVTEGQNGAHPVIYSGFGMGVSHNNDGQHTIDGSGLMEVVIFSFDKAVTVDWAQFGYFDSSDDFEFFADSDNDSALNWLFSDIDIPWTSWYALSSLWPTAGTVFGIGADYYDDTFKLKTLIVTEVSEVPLPGALALFLSGAAGLGFAGRRRVRARTGSL